MLDPRVEKFLMDGSGIDMLPTKTDSYSAIE